jgi:hypothetical protein
VEETAAPEEASAWDRAEEHHEELAPPSPETTEEPQAVPPRDEGGRHEVVVDLGHFEDGAEPEGADEALDTPEETVPVESVKEPALAGAPAPPSERSGLLGAVRSAFARKVTHEHEFVEAPGGIGIIRQICAECGYISIGVSD